MITVNLVGGLGNTLFQYAYARALSLKYDVKIRDDCKQYGCSLGRFNITVPFISSLVGRGISEEVFTYNPKQEIEDPCVLFGYWQSEKNFIGVESVLRSELTLKGAPSEYAQALSAQLEKEQSVAIHIRRGDYLTWAREVHGVLPIDYYLRAAEYLLGYKKDLKFYVFSDDPEWSQNNFSFPYVKTVAHSSPHEDLWIMSKCKHFIIANSSFSWWGAWLSDYKEKIVVAPKQWFAQGNENSKDIVPERWIRL